MKLALFDFDGTITRGDSFIPFLRFVTGRIRTGLALTALAPSIAAYRAGLVRASWMRQAVALSVLSGRSQQRVQELGARYCRERFDRELRPEAQARLAWHTGRGDRIVIVSASLDFYLRPWCQQRGFELICSRMQARGGRLTGLYEGRDCTGAEKARRVRAEIALEEFSQVYAYGDTPEDEELLALADEARMGW